MSNTHEYGSLRILVTQMSNKGTNISRIHREHLRVNRTRTPVEKLESDLKRHFTEKMSRAQKDQNSTEGTQKTGPQLGLILNCSSEEGKKKKEQSD